MVLSTPFAQRVQWLVVVVLLAWHPRPGSVQAQNAQWSRWYFGNQSALRFTPDSAVVLRDSRLMSTAACASVSDSLGRLLLYTNGRRVWNGRHQVLMNGARLGGDSVTSQGCSLVPNPVRRGFYYLFTLNAGFTSQPPGLRVAEIDVRAAGGQGQVTVSTQVVVPDSLLQRLGNHGFMEAQALVRHANGQDFWLVTHLLDTNLFISVQVTGNGFPRSAIVTSAAGIVHTLQPGSDSRFDATGAMAVSPNGRRLGLISQILGAEVFDFDPATGRVTNPVRLGGGVYSAGIAFSPNGALVYLSRQGPGFGTGCSLNAVSEVRQYDLQLPTPAAVAASAFIVYVGCGRQVWGMQRALDGRIYAAGLRGGDPAQLTNSLDVIAFPNVRGTGCQYLPAAIDPGANRFPNRQFPVVPNEGLQARLQALRLPAVACAGQAVALSIAGATLGAVGDTLDWSFGDGSTLRTTVPQATHSYAVAGTYSVVVRLRNRPFGPPEQLSAIVRVAPRLELNLGPDVRLCPGTSVQLTVGTLVAGTTVRWHDGSTAATHPAASPGYYWAELTSAAGCNVRDSVVVTELPGPVVALNADLPLCAEGSVVLSPGPQPPGSQYRWQDGSTAATFLATAPGTFTVAVTSPVGCQTQATLVLGYGASCLINLPNIITPNGDAQNQAFVLKGLNAPDWSLRLYNRWGREIYAQEKYDNTWAAQDQPAGMYYYLLINSTTGQKIKGWVEVVK